ncbi:pyruvate decarboxylase [Thelephora ganbajun]|uniref:Pyruvate decarboxylase n=1 Tax=Thelephora ganbajun TaxID=370292 RepID=A0ACB6Z2S4_THEGA|nr:pyruvate decarboxylase [Thelephora ganbajun]
MAQSTEHITSTANLHKEISHLRHELKTTAESHPASSERIRVGDYLLERLVQLGVTTLFGVPGDFNLGFLDLVEDHPKIHWAGNCNELNASYAADGFARVKEGSVGAVVTTFGVGELSAINGIAGSFSEHVPVVHIVGTPNTLQLKTKPMLHHTLGDGRFDAYQKAAEQFTISQAHLTRKENADVEIDRVLTDCIISGRPVYLTLPTDVAYERISAARLSTPLNKESPENDPDIEASVVESIYKLVKEADGDVAVLVDACAIRHRIKKELREFLDQSQFPVYAAPMGKTAIDEDHARYGGVYVGSISHPEILEKVEGAKFIISIGSMLSDFNTGNFTYHIPKGKTIELHSDHSRVLHALYPGIGFKKLLPNLTAKLAEFREVAQKTPVPSFTYAVPDEPNDIISQAYLWPRVGQFFKPKDVILAETGTSSFGIIDVPLPKEATLITQVLWGSIGYSVGATLGAACAARDLNLGRTILFVGDGSLQLTVQELSTMVTNKLTPIIFVLNNSGYTIERYIRGMHRQYNNVASWDYTQILKTFTGGNDVTVSYKVKTKAELNALLNDETFKKAEKMQLVEIIMPAEDAPASLSRQTELGGKTNHYGDPETV